MPLLNYLIYLCLMLTKRTKYGLKALVYIARKNDDQPVRTSIIAKDEGLSLKFLESIMNNLRIHGFLGSKKGKYGGYYLLQDPKDIRMVDVIRALEGPIAMVPCVSLNYYSKCDDCKDEDTCSINRLMIQVRDSMLNVFRNNSLADLAKP